MFGFGFSKRQAATKQAIREVGWTKGVADKRGVAGILFWADAYLLGFVQGTISSIVAKMSEDDKEKVYLETIKANGMNDAVSLIMLMRSFTTEQHPDFLRGSQNAMNVMLLQAGQFPPAAYDATIKLAIADAGNIAQWAVEAGKPNMVPHLNAAAALALRERYLGPYLEKHFAKHFLPKSA